jgi:hypothetical protein
MVLLEEVVAGAGELEKLHTNIAQIKGEMKQLREAFRERLKPLLDRAEELEETILRYMGDEDLPIVRVGPIFFQRVEMPHYMTKQSKIETVLKNEPKGTDPDVMTKKIVQALGKRSTVAASPDNNSKESPRYKLKVFKK